MSFAVRISIPSNTAGPALARVREAMEPSAVAKVAGLGAHEVVRNHLLAANRDRPNRLGGRRTEFYRRAANLTSFTSDATGAIVSIGGPRGIAQRFFGGTVVPKNSKYLTVPAIAAAHGKRARDFRGLVFMRNKGKETARLVDPQTGAVYYWLVKRVTQQPDRTVLPADEEIVGNIRNRLDRRVARAIRDAGPAQEGTA